MAGIKKAADGRRQRSRKVIDEERKVQGQEQILAEQLERNDFSDLDKERK